jgi:glycosyltransferase involved in cell wall biosynthesis
VKLFEPSEILGVRNLAGISLIEQIVWDSRPDLQEVFPLTNLASQKGFREWARVSLFREYGIDQDNIISIQPRKFSLSKLLKISRTILLRFPRLFNYARNSVKLFKLLTLRFRIKNKFKSPFQILNSGRIVETDNLDNRGVNLIGYVFQELGMGEHVRNSALALASSDYPFYLLNFDGGSISKKRDRFEIVPYEGPKRYQVNLIHANADQMLSLIRERGLGFFANKYNIGFWAWELEKAPENWRSVIALVDEIWAPSTFVANSFRAITDKPIKVMPLAVQFSVGKDFDRSKFGIPSEVFTFLYFFDFFSYMHRKNAISALRAFLASFENNMGVFLVIKLMNGSEENPLYVELLKEVKKHKNVVLINKVLSQDDLYSLLNDSNSFISLHRSEGFGRGPAEALFLGKPVVVTGYSGNMDFTNHENSFLVNFHLVPVGDKEYPFSKDQSWAEPDWLHAAKLMQDIFEDQKSASNKGEAGSKLMRTRYSRNSVAEKYQERLNEIYDELEDGTKSTKL